MWLRSAIFAVLAVVGLSGRSRAGEAEIARFRSEYPAALTALKEAYRHLKAHGTIERHPPGPRAEVPDEVEIFIDHDLQKAVYHVFKLGESGPIPVVDFVSCVGPEVSFNAVREHPRKVYTLKEAVRTSPSKGSMDDVRNEFRENAGKYIQAPFALNGWADDLFSPASRATVTEAVFAREGEDQIMRLKYRSGTDGGQDLQKSGSVDLLPSRGWAVRRHRLEGAARKSGGQAAGEISPYVMSVEVDYAKDSGGIPVPLEVLYGSKAGLRCRFDRVELGASTPASAFTVNGYNLPDPTKPVSDPARSTAPYWLIVAAVLAIICVFILRRKGAG